MSDKNTDESLLKTWAEAQQKLLTDWLDTLRRLGGTPTLELWTKTVDAWQSSVKETVDARAESTRQLIETLANAKGTPEELRELARKEQEQVQHWAEAERELWQDSARKMIDAQAALVRRWTGGTTRTKKQE